MDNQEYEIVDIPVLGVLNKKSGELVNIVYRNEVIRSNVVCDVSPSGWDSIKTLFNNLIGGNKNI
jgi:hypothetical protein